MNFPSRQSSMTPTWDTSEDEIVRPGASLARIFGYDRALEPTPPPGRKFLSGRAAAQNHQPGERALRRTHRGRLRGSRPVLGSGHARNDVSGNPEGKPEDGPKRSTLTVG
jgi:hypothetical protein